MGSQKSQENLVNGSRGGPGFPAEPRWIEVPGGWFVMGGGPRSNENPAHRVWVDDFLLAPTVVLRSEYQDFLDATGHTPPPFWDEPRFGHPRMPAVGPCWHDAMAYCEWVGAAWDRRARLPSEAEWERAAGWDPAGGEASRLYPWGEAAPEDVLPDYASRWQDGPEVVDAYPSPHPLGFFGLGENVHEWCSDWYDAEYYAGSPERNPPGATPGKRRASRGGAWRHKIKVSRCVARSAIPPAFQYSDYGFRLAADPAP